MHGGPGQQRSVPANARQAHNAHRNVFNQTGRSALQRTPGLSAGWCVWTWTSAGSAALGYAIDDGWTIRGEQALDSSVHHVEVLLDDTARDAQIVLRAGAESVPTELIIRGFECYCLFDIASEILDPPAGAVLKPMPRWSQFFGSPPGGLEWRVRHVRFSRFAEPRPMRWLHGLVLVLVPQDQTSRAVYVSGLYEPCTSSVLRVVLTEGKTCIDVGANIGLVSLLASRWVGPTGRVISFEPSGREFARLRQHIDLNPGHAAVSPI